MLTDKSKLQIKCTILLSSSSFITLELINNIETCLHKNVYIKKDDSCFSWGIIAWEWSVNFTWAILFVTY